MKILKSWYEFMENIDFTSDYFQSLVIGDYFYITPYRTEDSNEFDEPVKFIIKEIIEQPYLDKTEPKKYTIISVDGLEIEIEDMIIKVDCYGSRLFKNHRSWFELERKRAARIDKEYKERVMYLKKFVTHVRKLHKDYPEKLI